LAIVRENGGLFSCFSTKKQMLRVGGLGKTA